MLIAYVALPFDLVPDFISVAGQLDVLWEGAAAIDRVERQRARPGAAARALAPADPDVQPPVRSARGLEPAHDAGALVGKVAASRDERRGG